MLKHSNKDIFLVILAFIQVALLALPFFTPLSQGVLMVLVLVNIFLVGTNYQCVSHNFIHLPFFKINFFNQIFSIINSVGIGIPQSAYRLHHLQHHRYNNQPDKDDSSTRRHGKDGKDEHILSYSVLGVFRTDVPGLISEAAKKSKLVYIEMIFMVAFLGTLLALDWKLLIAYIVPSIFLGQVFALWENHCEHHHADPYDRKRDSVSCYNSFYNWIWFNNGYHQEHHFSPQVHWTKIPEVKSNLPDDRIIVKGCHLTNSF